MQQRGCPIPHPVPLLLWDLSSQPRIEPGPWEWEHGVLSTEPPGSSRCGLFLICFCPEEVIHRPSLGACQVFSAALPIFSSQQPFWNFFFFLELLIMMILHFRWAGSWGKSSFAHSHRTISGRAILNSFYLELWPHFTCRPFWLLFTHPLPDASISAVFYPLPSGSHPRQPLPNCEPRGPEPVLLVLAGK